MGLHASFACGKPTPAAQLRIILKKIRSISITFDTTQLIDESLNKAFQDNTNWAVITGAPSSGKTSVLEHLADLGHICISEVARTYIEETGSSNDSVRSNEASFQRIVTEKKVEIEASLDPNKQVFLDRGLPDSITYYRVAGLDPNEAAKNCYSFRYKKVFLFERLPFENDGVRIEDASTSDFIQKWLEKDYRSLGYEPIFVPIMSIPERAEMLIKHLKNG